MPGNHSHSDKKAWIIAVDIARGNDSIFANNEADELLPLVIIPAKNEQATVGSIVREVKAAIRCDVVVVDDRSSDNTAAEARQAGALVLPLSVHLGAWGAIQTGMRYALRSQYEVVVTMDADGQHSAEYLPALLTAIHEKQADVIVGSCVQRGSKQRRIAWRFFKALTGLNINDLSSGLRAYNKAALKLLASTDATLLDYQDIGVLLLLQKAGLKVSEIPTEMSPRLHGHSKIFYSWRIVFLYLFESWILSVSKRNR